MNLHLDTGTEACLAECYGVFENSEIFERYFANGEGLSRSLAAAVREEQLYLARSETGEIAGAMRAEWRGFCGLYPYLALLGTKDSFRGQGVGRFLLSEYHRIAKERGAKRVTLMVSHFNTRAKAFYEAEGYCTLGLIPNAVREGIDEYLMIKDL